jgi:hypothetical protein
LLGNDLVNTFPGKRMRETIGRPLLGNGSVNKPSQQYRGCFLRGPWREVIKGQRWSFERVVANWVEFWTWQSRVIRMCNEDFMCDSK